MSNRKAGSRIEWWMIGISVIGVLMAVVIGLAYTPIPQ
jgi:hypothetical protein